MKKLSLNIIMLFICVFSYAQGGKVVRVNNLFDNAGTLQCALSQNSLKTIIFDVSGKNSRML